MNPNPLQTQSITDVVQLEDLLSEPTEGVIDTMRRMEGDLIMLGVGGKMGPTLARMARRASDAAGVDRRVIAVSRFADDALPRRLESNGIEAIRCDLLDTDAVRQLPDAPNVLYMVGLKFGTQENQALTWAMNTVVPSTVAQRYPGANTVAMSTGNVYGLVDIAAGGSRESDTLRPVGEYAMSAVGRERVFEFFARRHDTPTALIRLYYAVEMRYGVPVDIAEWVHARRSIDLSMGYTSLIWQGDANAYTLQSFDRVSNPAQPINVAGPSIVSVRAMAEGIGERMGIEPIFEGEEAPTALACDTSLARGWFGEPRVSLDQMLTWIADWVTRDMPRHGKPTHFENRVGDF
ncbi:MAG: NAD-dependent epimerase/dehydratase family protein [Planctomycetota bacterium]|jgi:nucleoside-diphosphate-sugar epimerase